MSKLRGTYLRHGECFIRPVSRLPKGKIVTAKSYVVGHSETGHHHVLEADEEVRIIEPANVEDHIFFELVSNAKVVHKKTVNRHNDLTLVPGVYEVIHKQEYDPFQKVMRAVWD